MKERRRYKERTQEYVREIQRVMRRFLAIKEVESMKRIRKADRCLVKVRRTLAAFKITNQLRKYCELVRSTMQRDKPPQAKRRIVLKTDNTLNSLNTSMISVDNSSLDTKYIHSTDLRKENSSKLIIQDHQSKPNRPGRLTSSSFSKFQSSIRYLPLTNDKSYPGLNKEDRSRSNSSQSDSAHIDYLKEIQPRYLIATKKSQGSKDYKHIPHISQIPSIHQIRQNKPITQEKLSRMTISPNKIQIQVPSEPNSRPFSRNSLSISKKRLPYRISKYDSRKSPVFNSSLFGYQDSISITKLPIPASYTPEIGKLLHSNFTGEYLEIDTMELNRRSYSRQIQRQAEFKKRVSSKLVKYKHLSRYPL